MNPEAPHADLNQSRRVELILQQLDALPTLSTIAIQVLELTSSDDSEMRDVIDLISCDPSLSSKVLQLCRTSERGRIDNVTTVDRAVILLGIDIIRSAVLSVQVFELFDGIVSSGGEVFTQRAAFDRNLFWQHSLAVAITSEMLCKASSLRHHFSGSEAFTSGLLHDLGQLCLHLILPKSFDRVCELAVAQHITLDLACRQTIGIDSHTAGRRLAEHWQLPHRLCDVLWLHGQPYDSLPDLDHKPLIGLVSLADAIVRKEHIAPLGHSARGENISQMCKSFDIDMDTVTEILPAMRKELENCSKTLGLNTEQCIQQLLRTVIRANEVLGRANVTMRQNAQNSRKQAQVLEAITAFHDSAAPGGSVVSLLSRVVQSATRIFGEGFYTILYQSRNDEPWQLYQFDGSGRLQHSQIAPPSSGILELQELTDNVQLSPHVLECIPSISEVLADTIDLESVRKLPLRCGWGVNAVLLHNCPIESDETRLLLEALSRTWGAAIAAGAQHEGAKRLGEQLVEANRELVEAQDSLAQTKTMAAVGELASGAAHEMNNPLTVISGRSQMLLDCLVDPEQRTMAKQIALQSHRLSDIITALRLFAEPTKPCKSMVSVQKLVTSVIQHNPNKKNKEIQLHTVLSNELPEMIWIDADQIGRALKELIRNAMESEGSSHIELRVQIDPANDRLKFQVTDDGSGMEPHTLTHAFDPFFSAKAAGRQPGLGLAQARRLVEASNGTITLENGSQKGAVGTIKLSGWRGENQIQRSVA